MTFSILTMFLGDYSISNQVVLGGIGFSLADLSFLYM